jgi:ketosteroid isomerase-like protein
MSEGNVLGGTYHGHAAVREFFEAWMEVWDEFRAEPEEFFDGGDPVVVAVGYWGRGRVLSGSTSP